MIAFLAVSRYSYTHHRFSEINLYVNWYWMCNGNMLRKRSVLCYIIMYSMALRKGISETGHGNKLYKSTSILFLHSNYSHMLLKISLFNNQLCQKYSEYSEYFHLWGLLFWYSRILFNHSLEVKISNYKYIHTILNSSYTEVDHGTPAVWILLGLMMWLYSGCTDCLRIKLNQNWFTKGQHPFKPEFS